MKSGLELRPVFHWAPHRIHDVAAKLLQRLVVVDFTTHGGVQAEPASGDYELLVRPYTRAESAMSTSTPAEAKLARSAAVAWPCADAIAAPMAAIESNSSVATR